MGREIKEGGGEEGLWDREKKPLKSFQIKKLETACPMQQAVPPLSLLPPLFNTLLSFFFHLLPPCTEGREKPTGREQNPTIFFPFFPTDAKGRDPPQGGRKGCHLGIKISSLNPSHGSKHTSFTRRPNRKKNLSV